VGKCSGVLKNGVKPVPKTGDWHFYAFYQRASILGHFTTFLGVLFSPNRLILFLFYHYFQDVMLNRYKTEEKGGKYSFSSYSGFIGLPFSWFDETHVANSKAAGYSKWFNPVGPDMIKEKMETGKGITIL
jgi:hypothetical protein